jgi:CheY-like chemotaxis protein
MAAFILVIEDDSDTLELMTYLLGTFGHRVATAQDGLAGLAAARAQHPDLILCDVQLPKLDGFGIVRALAADPALEAIPRVALTASAMVGDRDKLLAAGFHFYLSKPITPETFIEQINDFLPAALRVSGKRDE